MPAGFFSAVELEVLKDPVPRHARCDLCRLEKGCVTPHMKTFGNGRKGIMVVAEAPGEHEDRLGRPLIGPTGRHLKEVLLANGVNMDEDCWLTNSLICRPKDNKIPDNRMVDWCRPNLLKEIDRLNPRQIILLGAKPVRSVIGHMWKKSESEDGGITRWSGWTIPWREKNCWVCPTYHPSYVQKSERDNREEETIRGVFNLHLAEFAKVKGRPFPDGAPDDLKRVELIYDDAEAAGIVASITNTTVAFDLETDRLKPQHGDAAIASCSVAWKGRKGLRAVAFPWAKKAAREMKALLSDPNVRKIGANLNFETNWIYERLGVRVRGWCWDTILQAHCLDCRKGVTSVKFQAFVRLGVEDYDSRIKKYLQSETPGGNEPNRIFDCDRELLLKYGALDALYEYQIALDQADELGVDL